MATLHDTYTKVVSHFNGDDAATAYTDDVGGAYTFAGTAQLDTAQKKFGTASLMLDGNSDYVTLGTKTSDYDFGTGNFTIEFYFRLRAVDVTQTLVSISGGSSDYMYFDFNSSGGIIASTLGILNGIGCVQGSVTCVADTWYHVVFNKVGTKFKMYLDNVYIKSDDVTGDIDLSNGTLNVGRYAAGGNYTNGWIDELRITKGVARYPDTTDNIWEENAEFSGVYCNNTVTATDRLNRNRFVTCSETVTTSDPVIIRMPGKLLIESITSSDPSGGKGTARELREDVTLAESIDLYAHTKDQVKLLNETMFISDDIAKTASYIRQLTEQVSVTHTSPSKYIRIQPFVDGITMSEDAEEWLNKKDKATTWSTITSTSSTWTPVPTASDTWV